MEKLSEAFVIRPTSQEGNEYMITIGNHLATEEKYEKVVDSSFYCSI